MATASNGIPLTVIAGIPKDAEDAVGEKLIRHYRHRDGRALRDFAFVSGLKEGGEYRAYTISKSLEALSERIHARRSRDERAENPGHLSVVFLESTLAEDNARLVESFFVFAQCVMIRRTENAWNAYTIDQLKDIFVSAIDAMSPINIQGRGYLFLPLRQFQLDRGRTLFEDCLERAITDPGEIPVTRERLNISKCERKHCDGCAQPRAKPRPVDSRGLCFSSSAPDGSPFGADTIWNRLRTAKTTAEKIFYSEIFFSSYYRFGAPILPGTHFDVQYPGSRKIEGETFDCPQHGKMPRFNRRYVNMYPNGVINAPGERSKEEKGAGDEASKA